MESSVEPQQDEDLTLVLLQFEEYADATLNSRALSEKCRDYRDGKQWTEDERNTLKKRRQPCITDNKIQDKCDTLLGIEKQQRSDPKAFPRNPADEGSAEAATDSLRYVADCSDFNRSVRKPAADNLIVEGSCFGQVVVTPRKGKYPKIHMEHIRWDRGYYDVHSLREDFADKTYAGFFTWMDFEQAKLKFDPRNNKHAHEDAIEHLEASNQMESAAPGETHDDKPRYIMTVRNRKRVQIFEHCFLKGGVWHQGKFCKGGWLESPKPSAYKNEDDEPECCIEIQALYRDRDGNPYGSVPRYIDLQDEHNKRRSKMLHLLNAKRLIAPKEAFPDGMTQARNELHKPDGVIEIAPGYAEQVKVEDNIAEAAGQWQLLQQTDMALSQTGPNAALQGLSGSISGRAKQLDQQSGTLPISPLFEALDAWELRMFRHVWNCVKQFWTAEMWIRVTDDEQKLKFVGLNQPVSQGEQIAERLKGEQMPPEQKAAILREVANDPAAQYPAVQDGRPVKRNEVARMDMDIIIDRTMDTVNIQQEQFQGLLEIAKVRPEVPFEVLIEASQLRSDTKKRVLDKLSGAENPQAQAMAQMQQRLGELEAMLKEAQIAKTMSEVAKNQAATNESHIDASVKVAEFTDPTTGQSAAKTQVSVN